MFYESNRDFLSYYSLRDHACSAHFHRSIELLHCSDKSRRVIINGEEFHLEKDQLLIVFPYDVHSYDVCGSNDLCVGLPLEYSKLFLSYMTNKSPSTRVLKNKDIVDDIYKHMQMLSGNNGEITINGITNYILGRIADNVETYASKNKGGNLITDIISFIDAHYFEDITLELLAKQFGYSKYYFSNLFNEKLKMGISNYVNSVRIYKSLDLLDSHKISDVYYKVGFNSPQQYFNHFKKVMKTTPLNYIKSHKKRT